MGLKRLISDIERNKLKDLKKYKGKKLAQLNQVQKDELLELVAKKLGLL